MKKSTSAGLAGVLFWGLDGRCVSFGYSSLYIPLVGTRRAVSIVSNTGKWKCKPVFIQTRFHLSPQGFLISQMELPRAVSETPL